MNIMNRLFGRKPDPVEQAKAWKQTLRYDGFDNDITFWGDMVVSLIYTT